MNLTICTAINGRRTLELRYHGYSRTVEPYAYGRDKQGAEVLRCYQQSGGSAGGQATGWKLLKVADVFAVHEGMQSFSLRAEYHRGDKAIIFLFCQA